MLFVTYCMTAHVYELVVRFFSPKASVSVFLKADLPRLAIVVLQLYMEKARELQPKTVYWIARDSIYSFTIVKEICLIASRYVTTTMCAATFTFQNSEAFNEAPWSILACRSSKVLILIFAIAIIANCRRLINAWLFKKYFL